MAAKLEVIKGVDVIMVHENEAYIYGETAQRCVDLVKTINSPQLWLAYDPANFVWSHRNKSNMRVSWPIMKPYVAHIYIKDWKVGDEIGSIPGTGDAQIKELLAELATMEYTGCITMEPHLEKGGQFGGATSPELFAQAIAAVRQLCAEAGLEYE